MYRYSLPSLALLAFLMSTVAMDTCCTGHAIATASPVGSSPSQGPGMARCVFKNASLPELSYEVLQAPHNCHWNRKTSSKPRPCTSDEKEYFRYNNHLSSGSSSRCNWQFECMVDDSRFPSAYYEAQMQSGPRVCESCTPIKVPELAFRQGYVGAQGAWILNNQEERTVWFDCSHIGYLV